MDIHKKYRGLGYAKPSYLKFIKYLKEEFKIKTIFLEVLSSNKRAINIYNKLDFTIISVEPHDKVDNTVKMKLDI
jgi:ribosomal protein S18 acetylase RimI-like enzyme